jgi:hypothetical protein
MVLALVGDSTTTSFLPAEVFVLVPVPAEVFPVERLAVFFTVFVMAYAPTIGSVGSTEIAEVDAPVELAAHD